MKDIKDIVNSELDNKEIDKIVKSLKTILNQSSFIDYKSFCASHLKTVDDMKDLMVDNHEYNKLVKLIPFVNSGIVKNSLLKKDPISLIPSTLDMPVVNIIFTNDPLVDVGSEIMEEAEKRFAISQEKRRARNEQFK